MAAMKQRARGRGKNKDKHFQVMTAASWSTASPLGAASFKHIEPWTRQGKTTWIGPLKSTESPTQTYPFSMKMLDSSQLNLKWFSYSASLKFIFLDHILCCMPVNTDIQEAKVWRSQIWGHPEQLSETLPQNKKIKWKLNADGVLWWHNTCPRVNYQ